MPGSRSQEVQRGNFKSRKGRGLHEVVPEVGIRGNLHLDFGNSPRMHHGSTQATQYSLPKHLWGLSSRAAVELRSRGLDQGSTTSGKKGCSHSCESQYWNRAYRWPAHGFGTGEGCLPHSKHRNGVGKLGKQRMGTLCLCLLHKIPAFFYWQYFTRGQA